MKRTSKSKGVTLIELMIVLVIISIVLTVSFSFFGFANRILSKGEDQSVVQQGVRMAAHYISDEIRTAKDVTILEVLPAEVDMGLYNYIYVEGSTIKHRNVDGTVITDVMKLGISDLVPELNFKVANNNTLLDFKITSVLDDQDFSVTSEVTPLNLVAGDFVQIDAAIAVAGGAVLRYSDPIIDDNAIIRIDALMLDLQKSNAFMHNDGGVLVLEEPTTDPNHINLPVKGLLGSTITWTSNSIYIIPTGNVYRQKSAGFDQNATLTATVSKGTGVPITKTFSVRINKLLPLSIEGASTTINANLSDSIAHQLIGIGGNPGYTFTSGSLPSGFTLDLSGVLTGIVTGDESFQVVIEDSHINTSDLDDHNTATVTITIDTP